MHKIKYFTLAKCNNCFQYIVLVFWTPSHFTQSKTNNPTSVGWMEYSNIFEHRLIDWEKLGKLMLLPTQSQSHKNFCNNLSKLSHFWGVQLKKKLNLSSFWIRSNIVKSGYKSTLQSSDYNLLIRSCYGTGGKPSAHCVQMFWSFSHWAQELIPCPHSKGFLINPHQLNRTGLLGRLGREKSDTDNKILLKF